MTDTPTDNRPSTAREALARLRLQRAERRERRRLELEAELDDVNRLLATTPRNRRWWRRCLSNQRRTIEQKLTELTESTR